MCLLSQLVQKEMNLTGKLLQGGLNHRIQTEMSCKELNFSEIWLVTKIFLNA